MVSVLNAYLYVLLTFLYRFPEKKLHQAHDASPSIILGDRYRNLSLFKEDLGGIEFKGVPYIPTLGYF